MIAAYALLSVYALWLFYLAVMNLKRAKDAGTISPVALWLGYPILLIGLLLDWGVNVVVFTILFLELPATFGELVTGRLKRYAYDPKYEETWRREFAIWFAVHLLNEFDPSGKHV